MTVGARADPPPGLPQTQGRPRCPLHDLVVRPRVVELLCDAERVLEQRAVEALQVSELPRQAEHLQRLAAALVRREVAKREERNARGRQSAVQGRRGPAANAQVQLLRYKKIS